MQLVQVSLFEGPSAVADKAKITDTLTGINNITITQSGKRVWAADRSVARTKLSSSRLQDQMFAYTVTNQVINAFIEVGVPFIQRGIQKLWNKSPSNASTSKKKRVAFEDEKAKAAEKSEEEQEFLDNIRRELALPDYAPFEDYSELVTQFGYAALWSTIWPLAPGTAHVLRRDNFVLIHPFCSHGPRE